MMSGCDVIGALILAPFFPGKPQPPPEDLACPLELAAPAEEPPLPATFSPEAPALVDGCDPGSKVLHRLNRAELDNTLRDLVGVDLKLAATSFPLDDSGAGFDNNAAVLAMSPLLVEKLEAAATTVVDAALQRPGEVPVTVTEEAEYGLRNAGQDLERGEAVLGRGGDVDVQMVLPNAAGTYIVRVRAGSDAEGASIEVLVDGKVRLTAPVTASADDKQLFEMRTSLDKGPIHHLGARFPPDGERGGDLRVDFFEVEGPLTVTELGPDPPARRAIVDCALAEAGGAADDACVRHVVQRFASRAWRRPVEDRASRGGAELDRLMGFFAGERAAGDDVETALRSTLVAVLLSPWFLYRVELDPDLASSEPHVLDDHELATRLSYFLWSSMPDDRLRALADEGALQDPAVLESEARRMLDSPKSRALVENFAGQWLFTRATKTASPDPERFAQFDESLRSAMQCETELTFDLFLRDPSLSMLDMVTLDETFVNDRLAAHYGLEPPQQTMDHGWGVVSLDGTGRSGILTQASILTVTSQPTRTSPTRRGRWVLENLLCVTPPPPPPGVEGLPEPPQGQEQESVRERLEQHRSDPFCASCHAMIDPIGFGLEHFDAIGRWRGSDAGFAIDDSALYMDDPGRPFHGARELGEQIHDDALLPQCIAQKTMTYALGKGYGDESGEDLCNVEQVAAKFAEGGYRMSDLILEVVKSPAFRMRRPLDDTSDDEVTP